MVKSDGVSVHIGTGASETFARADHNGSTVPRPPVHSREHLELR